MTKEAARSKHASDTAAVIQHALEEIPLSYFDGSHSQFEITEVTKLYVMDKFSHMIFRMNELKQKEGLS